MPTVPVSIVGPSYADEEWRAIPGYEGYYEASSLGRIKSLRRVIARRDGYAQPVAEKILAQKVMNKSYRGVALLKDRKQTTFLVHRLVMQAFEAYEGPVDHVDRCGANNAISNLRRASLSQNQANQGMRRNNTSGFKGVTWDRRANRWMAQISVANKRQFLGYFKVPEEAARKYDSVARAAFGPFAGTNFAEAA